MMVKTMIFVCAFLSLTACATNPPIATPKQLAGAYYGAYPDNYQDIIKNFYTTTLLDPYSAHYRFPEKPIKGYTRKAPIVGGAPEAFGYVVPACVNAKNRFGGYVGEQCHRFLIRNGTVIAQFDSNPFFKEPWYQ